MDDQYINPSGPALPGNEQNKSTPIPNQDYPELEKFSKESVTFLRGIWSFFLILIICVSLVFMTIMSVPVLQNWLFMFKTTKISGQYSVTNSDVSITQNIKKLKQRLYNQKKRLDRLTPKRPYLIIDTFDNYFYLMKGKTVLREGPCSTGSYILLKTENEKQQWIFKTPRGMFRIKNKLTRPVWKMPDWAFIEEGRPVPPLGSPDRSEYGVLGDYGLQLGRGYMIHGTLYQRFLGLPVTHGCVRLGDEDLEFVYKKLTFGSKVFMY